MKARNVYGIQSDSEVFAFTVDLPWYQEVWAYLLYGLVVIVIFWSILQSRTAHLKRQRSALAVLVEERTQDLAVARDEAETARIRAEKANQSKSTFLANMSHELRTPLNAILGMTEVLQEKVIGQINAQQLKALQIIERGGSHLLELINDILDLAKVESGLVELEYSPVAATYLCKSSLTFVKEQSLNKQIQLHQNVPSHLPDIVVDERRIRQVLINLLNNAVKFTLEGGHVTLEVTPLLPDETRHQKYLRFTVTDTGIGIAPDALKKLFQPFVQIDSALNRQYEGTGLGLALVKRIVELHGGQVAVTSEVGVGSCFTIELPYNVSKFSNPISPTAPDSSPVAPEIEQPTIAPLILLAEDNDANILTLSSYLRAKGYRIQVAKDGQATIELAQAELPNLILMDIHMPGMDGLMAIQHIRQLPVLSEVPIIALTALAMAGDRERCLEAGANLYLSKPVKLKQLILSIQKLLTQ
ncbi:response regulator [Leptolyngbya cf. ectocarpi LEGE 11479]|uniref:histidine kinase n=1 Tax=Leptolyngbya cf. ectocarpi LEGE 11479 TaxID=1828722 RepID=A0A928ZUA5_LEPEC|nr:response regulator [Leptolyngbya cf. ectocarpi LEGE 11479]